MSDTDKKIDPQEIRNIVKEYRDLAEKKNSESGEIKEKMGKLEDAIMKHEEGNQKLVKKLAEEEKFRSELEGKYKDLEKALYTSSNSAKKDEISKQMKSFESFVVKGFGNLSEDERKYLRTDSNIDGGYLAPAEYAQEITKKITEVSPIRSVARIRTTSSPRMEIPLRSSLATASWVGEAKSSTASNSQYGLNTIKVEKLTGESRITLEELSQSAFNMETEITNDMVERFQEKEGQAFVTGLGAAGKQPLGFMTSSDVSSINSGAAADITMDNIIELTGELKKGYNAMYGFNRKTFTRLLKLKGNDQYFWTVGDISKNSPSNLVGNPYLIIPDMDDIAAGKYPVVFADFSRGYTIVDHTTMLAIRDDYSLSSDGMVKFVYHRFIGGGVEVPEAIVKLKVAA